jgi:hypothetical protein
MAINFPDSPSNGDTHTASGRTFTYNTSKTKWVYSNSPNASVTSSDTAPSNPNVGDMWLDSTTGELLIYYADGSSNQWIGVSGTAGPQGSAGSSVTSYAAPSNFPSSGNTVGDFAFATNSPKALYVWDGSEWDRVWSGGQEGGPIFSTSPSSGYSLTGGANTDVTVAASDPDGFPITYSVVTNPSNQAQATITNPSSGVFRFAASNTASNAGNFTAKFIADDGVQKTTASSTLTLSFTAYITDQLVLLMDAADGSTPSDTSGNGHSITLVGSPPYTNSGLGGASSYWGLTTNARYISTNLIRANQSFSYSAWVRLHSNVISRMLNTFESTSQEWTSMSVENLYPQFDIDNNGTKKTATSSTAVSLNTWYNIVGTFNHTSGAMKIYLNNSNVASVTHSQTGANGTISGLNSLLIGATNGPPRQNFNGDIALVHTYSKELSTADVTANWDHYKSRYGY